MSSDPVIAAIRERYEAQQSRKHRMQQLAKSISKQMPAEVLTSLDVLTELEEAIAAYKADIVAAARYNGESWAKIGQNIGMSKQAAQQRYGAKPKPRPDVDQLTIDSEIEQ